MANSSQFKIEANMDTIVETYLKTGDAFTLIGKYSDTITDENYVEGAIRCVIAGQTILGQEHWDLVDQLWVYIVEGLVKLSRNEVYESSFPDQPLLLRLEPVSDYCVKVTIGEKAYNVDRKAFISVMKEGAVQFFDAFKQLCPASADTWDRYSNELKSIKP